MEHHSCLKDTNYLIHCCLQLPYFVSNHYIIKLKLHNTLITYHNILSKQHQPREFHRYKKQTYCTEIQNGKFLHLFSIWVYLGHHAQYSGTFMSFPMQHSHRLLIFGQLAVLFINLRRQRGQFKRDKLDFFFHSNNLGTKVFLYIEKLRKNWWRQKLGAEYTCCSIDRMFYR